MPGNYKTKATRSSTIDSESHIELLAVKEETPKRALDLFSGLGSATKLLQSHGYQVVSLDLNTKAGQVLRLIFLIVTHRFIRRAISTLSSRVLHVRSTVRQ